VAVAAIESTALTWTADACTDGTSTDQASCEDTGNMWAAEQPAACSDGVFTTQGSCEAANTGTTWSTVIAATCAAADTTLVTTATDQAACEKTEEAWAPAACSVNGCTFHADDQSCTGGGSCAVNSNSNGCDGVGTTSETELACKGLTGRAWVPKVNS
jgi:hypothetical protein